SRSPGAERPRRAGREREDGRRGRTDRAAESDRNRGRADLRRRRLQRAGLSAWHTAGGLAGRPVPLRQVAKKGRRTGRQGGRRRRDGAGVDQRELGLSRAGTDGTRDAELGPAAAAAAGAQRRETAGQLL